MKIHAPDPTFVIHNKRVQFWIRHQYEQLCVDVHRIRSQMVEVNVYQSNMIKLDVDQMTNALIQINAYEALVSMLAVLIDAELMHNVNRNYIVLFAHVHLDTLAIHILNAHQVRINS